MTTLFTIAWAVTAGAALALGGVAYWHLRVVRRLRRGSKQLARELRDRLAVVVSQRNEFEAVLTSMAEGVVAIDDAARLLSLNRAAAKLLRLERAAALGRSLHEAVRNSELQELVARTLETGEPQAGELLLRGTTVSTDDHATGDRTIQSQSAVLRDAEGQTLGAVIVLHDVTQLRRLESVRRDFVANVSHEVKTPVAAIKGAVETLLDDPDDDMPEDDRQRFLRMIARQADRLNAIVDDLLSLARIERGAEAIAAELEPEFVAPVLAAARETVQAKAAAKRMALELRCPADLVAAMVPALIEQAVTNLLDNAIKYSPEGTPVRLEAAIERDELLIRVIDRGRGIEQEHLPRVFERFYRTDRARSRELGGTGLGLSIVRHIAQTHGGRVTVESQPGKGSTFTLVLPLLRDEADRRSAA